MKERNVFLTKNQSLALRGIGIILVIMSHYAVWFAELIPNESLQYGMTRLGVYGVDIFLAASGYGLVKSVAGKKPGISFVWGRLKNTWLPYLVIVGLMEAFAGGFACVKDWYQYLSGYDYWFIRNILVFYIMFLGIWKLFSNVHIRSILLTAAVFLYSWWLVTIGRADFWYVSNIAFVLGILAAQYEKQLLRWCGYAYGLQMMILTIFVFVIVKSGVDARLIPPSPSDKIVYGVLASGVWTLFAVQLAKMLPDRMRMLPFLGRISLELYLTHTFLYYRVINSLTEMDKIWQGILAVLLTIVISGLIHEGFTRLLNRIFPAGGK
ncbi:MAG: acyltransferase [Lachnospiraceae bacterium]|nr:acyltransferase [Lachnospiraceae bacterium]